MLLKVFYCNVGCFVCWVLCGLVSVIRTDESDLLEAAIHGRRRTITIPSINHLPVTVTNKNIDSLATSLSELHIRQADVS